jgi:hypothetical protein
MDGFGQKTLIFFFFSDQESCKDKANEEEASSTSGETRYNRCSEASLIPNNMDELNLS